ncbi:MAG: aminotransferase class V-fold PLP-dependent enzyme [Saprospiraceae bacterium]|nr:aminotransferase class V-fold PLP-dependent enzyme [Saprospiraceae bacterium]
MTELAPTQQNLEDYFVPFRQHIIGQDQHFDSPFGRKRIIYADWTASGRMYQPIEDKLGQVFAPFVANTHTETNICGTSMTLAYHQARDIIKRHVNAAPTDCLISYGSGMTGVINKFQRILGLKIPEKQRPNIRISNQERPIVFVTHMEHHSNQTSWLETICDLEVIAPTTEGLVDLSDFQNLIDKYADRPLKIAAITACSNVTGIETPYYDMAEMIHAAGGLCFVDFACSAPYVSIDMHPNDRPQGYLDAIYFSPHKFLGGPGSSGILIFNSKLYTNRVPDNPGGGTVKWTNPWKEHAFIDDIEDREDGGTPPFLQTIRTALCIKLKNEMGIERMLCREKELIKLIFNRLSSIKGLHILASEHQHRLGVVSFYIENLHFNLAVKLLNDRFGIQVRGGCSCAGTYGHFLLEVDKKVSDVLTHQITTGDLSNKPGWVRMSIHPTMTNAEVEMICKAIAELTRMHTCWRTDYDYNIKTNEFTHRHFIDKTKEAVSTWFEF